MTNREAYDKGFRAGALQAICRLNQSMLDIKYAVMEDDMSVFGYYVPPKEEE